MVGRLGGPVALNLGWVCAHASSSRVSSGARGASPGAPSVE
ncbi:hypothetical protein AKJ08_2809 [Vulgatibacter incomptus]|uniref:Uncharacterized protein n=1 Tax=Vulgatibacter incomptus TaxID=1391653 RepID=A0A0K1PFZ0_9BACT|nr:hypothetical protein AKJ08_2809 [Vulgatibacter incomptus]